MKNNTELVRLANKAQNSYQFLVLVARHFKNKNLSTLLNKNISSKLRNCFNLERKVDDNFSTEVQNLSKYLALVNELLPNLPSNLSDEDSNSSPSTCALENYNKGLVEKLIADIIKPLFKILENSVAKDVEHSILLFDVYLKMLFFADINVLLDLLGKHHIDTIKEYLLSKCVNMIKIFSKAVVIITMRLPEYSRNNLLTQDIVFQIGQFTSELKYLDDFCDKYNLECVKKDTFWEGFMKKEFENEDFQNTFEALSEVFEKVTTDDLIDVRLIDKLIEFIQTSLQKKNDENMKLFLTKFVRVQRSDSDKNEIDSKILKNLVKSLVAVVEFFFSQICNGCNRSCYETCSDRRKELIENSIIIVKKTSDLLQYLYLISNIWYQWFNLFTATPLLKKEDFICKQMTETFESIIYESNYRDIAFITELASRCPVMILDYVRKDLCRSVQNIIRESEKEHSQNLEVQREMSLSEIASVADKMENKDILINGCIKYYFKFKDEIGRGRGPTKEFYSIASKEFQKYDYGLWLGRSSNVDASNSAYVCAENGLFPKHESTSEYESQFFALGKLMASALVEEYNPMDIPLSVEFFKQLLPGPHHEFYKKFFDLAKLMPEVGKVVQALLAVKQQKEDIESDNSITEDQKQDLIRSLKYDEECSFEDLFLNFTVPGSGKELVENGADIMLTQFNIDEYLDHLGRNLIEEDSLKAITEFTKGYNEVFPFDVMMLFLPEELQSLFCGEEFKPWSFDHLNSCCDYYGCDGQDENVQNLFKVMSTFGLEQQQQFLQFVTGTTRLPAGGLMALKPRLTIANRWNANKCLPVVSVCCNRLYLPVYTDLSIAKKMILLAITEGNGSFAYK